MTEGEGLGLLQAIDLPKASEAWRLSLGSSGIHSDGRLARCGVMVF